MCLLKEHFFLSKNSRTSTSKWPFCHSFDLKIISFVNYQISLMSQCAIDRKDIHFHMFEFTVMLFDFLKRWSPKLIEKGDYFDWLICIIFLSYILLFHLRCKCIVYNIQSSYTKTSKIGFSQHYEAEAINQRKIYSVLFCCNTNWKFFSQRKLIRCKYLRFDQKPDLQQVLETPRSSWQLASSERWHLTPQVQVQTNSLENAPEDSSCGSPTFHPCWQHRSLSGCCLELWGVHGVQPDYQHQQQQQQQQQQQR